MEKTNNFVPMFDLDRLSDEQLHQYYLDACAFHGVPPELNVLAFTYMDSGDGARRRVLYAKKGATDIIRERLGISVFNLQKEIFSGTLTYTCSGKNKDGRLEIAVGASYIEGLTGRVLEVAIMVAQTRAVRRMTLQFAGAGLLDETELQADSKTVDIKDALTAPQPTVKPNAAPGKDITAKEADERVKECCKNRDAITLGQLPGESNKDYAIRTTIRPNSSSRDIIQNPPIEGVSLQEIVPTQTQLEAQQALSKVPVAVLAKEAGESVPDLPKRRSRPKPVELDTPFSFDNPVPAPVASADILESKRTATPFVRVVEPILSPLVTHIAGTIETVVKTRAELETQYPSPTFERLDLKPVISEGVRVIPNLNLVPELPNDVQMKGFRDRLFTYTNTILPQAGMIPTENIGGIGMKVRIFAQAKFGQVLNQLTIKQWEEMFQLFDSTKPAELVKLIDETVVKAK